MKKIFSLLLITILAVTILAGCKEEKQKTQYSVLVDKDNKPYSYEEDGKACGFAVEILDAVAEEENMEINYVYDMGKDTYSACISTLTDGSDGYDYTDHFYQQGIVFANKKESDITTYEQLLHKTVGVLENSFSLDFACQIAPQYDIAVKEYKDREKLYDDVESGKLDGLFDDELAVKEKIKEDNTKLKAFPNSEKTNLICFAVNKDENKQFVESFNAGYKKIVENGTYEKIIKEYTE